VFADQPLAHLIFFDNSGGTAKYQPSRPHSRQALVIQFTMSKNDARVARAIIAARLRALVKETLG
jgi:hypothetical protein